ncbi:DUF3825 domain-containing protein [Vaginisenegalia massiliensis]|uniref:DUF3825 domain-containing protein n=1 Tax=Vaginisenegalia massiliensis TaxID=2058294 RepID=UPI000F522D6A|nr:DUF3825 domain-containing protein [Vaginisenegalia massiliensis]
MEIQQYLVEKDLNVFKRFASTGSKASFDNKLKYLTKIAEQEKWFFENDSGEDFSVIFYYIIHTFDQVFKQNKITINDDKTKAVFNTGLLTDLGYEIYGLFEKNTHFDGELGKSNYWHFKSFVTENERAFTEIDINKPKMATFFTDYNELYFNPDKEIEINFDHIYDDNFDRLPEELQSLEKTVAKQVFDGALKHTILRIKRNNRIPVPQIYNDSVMFLIPVKVLGTKTVVIAVEEQGKVYRANTILTMSMAYNCARLLTRPESNWLLI